jgi:hypothetical protein
MAPSFQANWFLLSTLIVKSGLPFTAKRLTRHRDRRRRLGFGLRVILAPPPLILNCPDLKRLEKRLFVCWKSGESGEEPVEQLCEQRWPHDGADVRPGERGESAESDDCGGEDEGNLQDDAVRCGEGGEEDLSQDGGTMDNDDPPIRLMLTADALLAISLLSGDLHYAGIHRLPAKIGPRYCRNPVPGDSPQ